MACAAPRLTVELHQVDEPGAHQRRARRQVEVVADEHRLTHAQALEWLEFVVITFYRIPPLS